MTHHICTMTEIILINTGTWKHFLRYMYQKMLPAMFMNITTHPYHLTEFKLCCVRDPSGICRRQINKPLAPQFQTKIFHFPHPFSDLASKIHTRFQTFVVS